MKGNGTGMGAVKKTMMAMSAVGAVAGLAYLSMKPSQQRKIERGLKKTTDQLSDIVDNVHNRMT